MINSKSTYSVYSSNDAIALPKLFNYPLSVLRLMVGLCLACLKTFCLRHCTYNPCLSNVLFLCYRGSGNLKITNNPKRSYAVL